MVAFSVFWFPIYWYWIFYFISFVVWYIFLYLVFRSSYLSLVPNLQKKLIVSLDNLILVIMLWVLIGGRLWHVFIYDFSYFLQEPLKVLVIWEWWMSFIGWMVGVFISLFVYLYKRKYIKEEFLFLLDIILIITPLGILLGRLWNYLNQELYWIIVPSNYRGLSKHVSKTLISLDVFHIYHSVDTYLRVNTNLLSMFFEWFLLFIFMLLWFFFLKKRSIIKPGFLVWLFLTLYSFFRFILEYFRQDSQYEFVWIFSRSQRFFVIFFCIGLYFLFFRKNKNNIT